MSRRAWREQAIITANAIRDARAEDRIMSHLTLEERDWLLILQERLYSTYNQRLPTIDDELYPSRMA